MNTPIPADSGSGFLTNTAAFAVMFLIAIAAICLPTVRSALADQFEQFRAYFIGPTGNDEQAGDTAPSDKADADALPEGALPKGRASDRDQHQFDLNVFSDIFGGPVDVPPDNA